MMDDQITNEKAYTTTEIAEKVGIAEPTVRKYAQSLEKSGYRFIKDAFGTRTYIEKDAIVIQQLKDIRIKSGMPVESVAAMLAKKYSNEAVLEAIQPISGGDTAISDRQIQQYDTDRLAEIIDERVRQQVSALQNTLLARLDERDLAIRELTEAFDAQRAIAATGVNELVAIKIQMAEQAATDAEQVEQLKWQLEQERADRLKEREEYLAALEDLNGRQAGDMATVLREIIEAKQQAALAAEAANRSLWSKLFRMK